MRSENVSKTDGAVSIIRRGRRLRRLSACAYAHSDASAECWAVFAGWLTARRARISSQALSASRMPSGARPAR